MLLSLPLGLPFDSRISPAPAHVISDAILLSFNLKESKPISRFSKSANTSHEYVHEYVLMNLTISIQRR